MLRRGQHHPHVRWDGPCGGLSHDGTRWIPGQLDFLRAANPLAWLFCGLFLERLQTAFDFGGLNFFGKLASLTDIAR